MLGTLLSRLFRPQRRWSVDEVRQLVLAGQHIQAREAANHLHEATPDREPHRLCLLAESAFREGRDAEAETLYRDAVRLAPGFADGHYGLSLLMSERGQLEAAVQHAQFAKGDSARDPRYLAQLGLCQLLLKNYSLAETPLRQAVQGNDSDKTSWNNLGIVLRAKAEFGEAMFCFKKAISLDGGFGHALQNIKQLELEVEESGGTWERAQPKEPPAASGDGPREPWRDEWAEIVEILRRADFDAALDAADALLSRWGDLPELVAQVARLYQSCGDGESAIHILNASMLREGENAPCLAALGSAYLQLARHREAELALSKAYALDRENAEVAAQLAQALHNQEKYEAAVEILTSIPAEAVTPSHSKLLGAALVMACEYERAIALYAELQAGGMSELSAAMGGLAMALSNQKRFDEALDLLGKVIDAYPAEPNVRAQRSHILLLRHEFAQGWEDYAFRGLSATKNFRMLPIPQWNGEPLRGRGIVVLAEQGLGDQVMFASCLPDLLAANPRRVVVEAIDRVAATLARSFQECEVVATKQNRDLQWMTAFEGIDLFVPLADLPRFFRRSVGAFPGTPYLKADPARVEHWKLRLAEIGPRPWLGVSWRGGTPSTRKKLRTMDPLSLAPHIRARQATWVSLQYGDVGSALSGLAQEGATLAHWPEAIANLDEFAALIAALDAVITVCNTTVHYAGGLGKPVWVLAPEVPEWRYGLAGRAMPWYGSARVLRQPAFGEWEPILAQAVDEAMTFLSEVDGKTVNSVQSCNSI